MKVKDLTLVQWQEMLDKFRAANPDAPNVYLCFRIDGTQFSTARHYGGFEFNEGKYTTFECKETLGAFPCRYATIAVRMDMLKWVTKKLKEEGKK